MQLRDTLTYEPIELTFGTSGLRGLVVDMTDLECYINAAGFLKFLRNSDNLKAGETIYVAGDLRDSTPRIMQVMTTAIQDAGFTVVNCGFIPTPALALYALQHDAPSIMVTGSHIPADRNGIKFYKRSEEVLKSDESAIHAAVAQVRQQLYHMDATTAGFGEDGSAHNLAVTPASIADAEYNFIERYRSVFAADSLAGKQVVVYQHSAVGRDMLVTIVEALGAEAIPVERSDTFLSIDTENVTEVEQRRFKGFSQAHPNAFAIISTDGDSDRPFVIDETGEFYRGDVLGCVVMNFLHAKFAATPVSSNDAVDLYCEQQQIKLVHTKIGSPYVIEAMQAASPADSPVGWEVNGGFLTGVDLTLGGNTLAALPTRDATLPILSALVSAAQKQITVSELFAALPARFTGGGLVDVSDAEIAAFKAVCGDQAAMLEIAQKLFSASELGEIERLDITDGLRLIFKSNVVLHLRPSGNAPQFRVYTNAASQALADDLVARAIAEGGYIQQLLAAV